MRDYELVAIISPEVDEDGVSRTMEKLGESIVDKGGTVGGIDNLGKRKLAYPLRKFMEANYILTRFNLEPELVKRVEGEIETWEEVLRFLLIKVED